MVKSFYIDKRVVFNHLNDFCSRNRVECHWVTNDRIDGNQSWFVSMWFNNPNELAMLRRDVRGLE